MSSSPSIDASLPAGEFTSVDKTIVDRRGGHRSTGSRLAVKGAREGIQSAAHEPRRFRDELLHMHALRVVGSRWPMVALCVLLAAGVAPFANLAGHIALTIWLFFAMGAIAANEAVSRTFLAKVSEGSSVASFSQRFTVVQAGHGLLWAAFLLIAHPFFISSFTQQTFASPGLPGPILLGVVLLVGATYLLISHALAAGVAWVCVLPFLSVAMFLSPATLAGDGMAAASLLGAATLAVMFTVLGIRLRDYARGNVQARMEKDHAVLEAEEAQNLSEEARRRAEEANMAKTRFLATMSHELRTPLNAILGFSEIMEHEVMGPLGNAKYKEYVGDIHASGSHLLKLINEILDLSRVEAGRYELHEEKVSLGDITSDAMQMVRLKANEKDQHLQIRSERTLPPVWADERAIRQVVLNLLSNAVKFTPKAGQIVVKVGWTGSGGQYVSVTDNGPGIAEEEIPIVLSAFGQGSVALRVAEPGSGLGLPIVQAFMKMHDGRLDLRSRLREGTTVTVIFPRKRVMTDEVAEAPARARAAFARAG